MDRITELSAVDEEKLRSVLVSSGSGLSVDECLTACSSCAPSLGGVAQGGVIQGGVFQGVAQGTGPLAVSLVHVALPHLLPLATLLRSLPAIVSPSVVRHVLTLLSISVSVSDNPQLQTTEPYAKTLQLRPLVSALLPCPVVPSSLVDALLPLASSPSRRIALRNALLAHSKGYRQCLQLALASPPSFPYLNSLLAATRFRLQSHENLDDASITLLRTVLDHLENSTLLLTPQIDERLRALCGVLGLLKPPNTKDDIARIQNIATLLTHKGSGEKTIALLTVAMLLLKQIPSLQPLLTHPSRVSLQIVLYTFLNLVPEIDTLIQSETSFPLLIPREFIVSLRRTIVLENWTSLQVVLKLTMRLPKTSSLEIMKHLLLQTVVLNRMDVDVIWMYIWNLFTDFDGLEANSKDARAILEAYVANISKTVLIPIPQTYIKRFFKRTYEILSSPSHPSKKSTWPSLLFVTHYLLLSHTTPNNMQIYPTTTLELIPIIPVLHYARYSHPDSFPELWRLVHQIWPEAVSEPLEPSHDNAFTLHSHAKQTITTHLSRPSLSAVDARFYAVWTRIRKWWPRECWVWTLNALFDPASSRHIEYADVMLDPGLVFLVPQRKWRGVICEILIHILTSTLFQSRHDFLQNYHKHIKNSRKATLDEAAMDSFLVARDVAIVQRVLVLWKNVHPSSHGTLGSFLHNLFCTFPSTIRILHLQTYDATLIPPLLSHVPSLHVCLDFVVSILSLPGKEVFGIKLLKGLVTKYPIQQSKTVIETVLVWVESALSGVKDGVVVEEWMSEIIQDLVSLITIFPTLTPKLIAVLSSLLPPQETISQLTQVRDSGAVSLVIDAELIKGFGRGFANRKMKSLEKVLKWGKVVERVAKGVKEAKEIASPSGTIVVDRSLV